ncbi:MAG: Asp23/Gls24 family envelope stress response protein [Thermotogota bacterium]|nr:Asp23/Gls24 family envelope stress response protein [Thermotogota bacterium]
MDQEKDRDLQAMKDNQGETQFGVVEISDSVIYDLVNVALGKIDEIVYDSKNTKKSISIERKNGENNVAVTVNIKVYLTKSVRQIAETVQQTIKEEVEGMTGLIDVSKVSVNILDVEIPKRTDEPEVPDDEIIADDNGDEVQ